MRDQRCHVSVDGGELFAGLDRRDAGAVRRSPIRHRNGGRHSPQEVRCVVGPDGSRHGGAGELLVDVGAAQPGGQLGGADQAVVAEEQLVAAAGGVAFEAVEAKTSIHQLGGDNDVRDPVPIARLIGGGSVALQHSRVGRRQWPAFADLPGQALDLPQGRVQRQGGRTGHSRRSTAGEVVTVLIVLTPVIPARTPGGRVRPAGQAAR